ncbi:MAG: cation-translocating P-type ATPase [Candidatus Acidiferrales bacterium]
MSDWHRQDLSSVLKQLDVEPLRGLTKEEASRRLKQYGRNELVEHGTRSAWRILWEQLTSSLVVVLIVAAVISALLRDYKDALAIAAIVILNALLGFTQEYRAEKALIALKKFAVPSVRVRRDGEVNDISAVNLVPGDIVLLEAGNSVAADCRIVESADLQMLEASLTGESEPIRKVTSPLDQADLPLGDRRNMAYMGTFVTAGRGQAVVTETGMRTELGQIASLIQTVHREPTPLQRRLHQLGKKLAATALFLVAVIFLLGLFRGADLKLMFLTAVSIAVAAIPEGLPAIVTIALTLGAQRMLKRRVLIRKLSAVETLGSVTVICSDKTGTLTENRMTAATLQLADRVLDFPALLRDRAAKSTNPDEIRGSGFGLLLAAAALCNDAIQQSSNSQPGAIASLGDPTETALVTAAAEIGLPKPELDGWMPRVAEVPFTSERKRMTTIHRMPSATLPFPLEAATTRDGGRPSYVCFTKGAPVSLLQVSSTIWIDGRIESLNESWRERFSSSSNDLARKGIRVLAVAFRFLDSLPSQIESNNIERDMTLIGMVGLIDPPRQEAATAVATCKRAGIRPVMITGDHPLTAQYIGEQLGITGGQVLTGPELDRLSLAQLKDAAESVSIYARVSPAHKLKIIQALQERGEIVSMTGDGVNDAPALKKADIGVAMGITGTDVAKETADIILLDDNFATIVAAVEEGRVIYDNVRKFIKYVLATNSGEIWVMLVAPLLGMPLPLLPLQILWMNLVTDGLPALALGLEPAESDTMRRPPYPPRESIFARGMGWHIIWMGLLMGGLAVSVGYAHWRVNDPAWQTMLFTTLTLSQMANVLAIRSDRRSLFRIGLLSNKPLLAAVTLTIVLQLALLYVPFLQIIFSTRPLSASQLAVSLILSAVILVAVEIQKWMARYFSGQTLARCS